MSEAKRLKTLEEENRRLKKLLAEQVTDSATLTAVRGELAARTGKGALLIRVSPLDGWLRLTLLDSEPIAAVGMTRQSLPAP